MVIDFAIKVTDVAIVLATFCGPIFAVRIQRYLDDRKVSRAAQERVFHTLMATRATWLAPARVEALNSIPIVFYGETQINEAWRELFHLFDKANSDEWKDQGKAWEAKRTELDVLLLRTIGSHLGYKFPALDVKTQHYFPVGLGDRISDEEAIRRGLARIMKGELPLPVAPIFPDVVFNEQNTIRTALSKVLSGEQPLAVRVHDSQT